VNNRNVPTEGGTNPSMSIFGATSIGIPIALIATITKKNDTSKVAAKNSAVPIIYPKSLALSRLVDLATLTANFVTYRILIYIILCKK
jgi:hypothetical protein